MFNQTRHNLNSFDNEHEFERLASDVLNSLGYNNVEPMAPLGGADGGTDILYENGKSQGIAFVTLRKDIGTKFKEDLDKYQQNSNEIALFCIVDITPKQKTVFTKEALAKGATLSIFDVERLRSLFDSTLKDLRRKYLGIDDDLTIQIKDKLNKIITFENTQIIELKYHAHLESMFVNKLPQNIFHLLMEYELKLLDEVPDIGPNLKNFLIRYDRFIGNLKRIEEHLITHIGEYEKSRIRESWKIHYKYSIMRYSGTSIEDIQKQGLFLNFGITWNTAEEVFQKLVEDSSLETSIKPLFTEYENMCNICLSLLK